MERDCFWLNDRQFARLEPYLPRDTRGKPGVDDRRVISGIVHVLKSGCCGIDAPAAYGPRKTLYNRFVRWAAKGVWTDIFHALASSGGPPAEVLIDASAVIRRRNRPQIRGLRTTLTIERMIGHLKVNRAIATRCDKLARSFLDALHIAAIRRCLRVTRAGNRYVQAASTRQVRASALPVFVIEPRRIVAPLECSDGFSPR